VESSLPSAPPAHSRARQLFLGIGLSLAFLPAVAAGAAAPAEYFTVRPDVRRCIAPLCGGFFIDPVNRRKLRCADGRRAEECYVAGIDLSALGPEATISSSPLEPPVVVRGVLQETKFEGLDVVLDTLIASELWEPVTRAEARGRFVRLSDSGVRCITEPCPSILAELLNRDRGRFLDEVDLSRLKLDERQREEAWALIDSLEGLVAAGRFSRRRGFVATEVYFPFVPVAGCEIDADCREGRWCRPDPAGARECVPFVGPGESCNGFVLPWLRERCEPDLQCVPAEPTGDLPGTCAACSFEGTPYQEGESFPAADGCNVCSCLQGGRVVCTEIACRPPPECLVSGCSGQLCVDAALGPVVTPCEHRPAYACLEHSRCGSFGPDGACAWEMAPEYRICLDKIAPRPALEVSPRR
jgi:eight-cysteine-cluster-containing protein